MVMSRLSDQGFQLAPLASSVGPFPHYPFLTAWWEELAPGGELLVVHDGRSLLSLHRMGSVVAFMGDGDLTDYHSPLGADPEPIVSKLAGDLPGINLTFDSLPGEASSPMANGLIAAGLEPRVSEDAVAMVLDLPATIEGYVEGLEKKERHELRRKRRRYEEQLGPLHHETFVGGGFGFDEFVRLHRLAPGHKGRFMTGSRLAFFSRLASQPGWRVDLLMRDGGVATAGLFGWSDERDYYLYNSSFDPALQSVSPGLVLLLSMIEHSINRGWGRFDFLKGDEPYKARLGARPRQLYRIDAVT